MSLLLIIITVIIVLFVILLVIFVKRRTVKPKLIDRSITPRIEYPITQMLGYKIIVARGDHFEFEFFDKDGYLLEYLEPSLEDLFLYELLDSYQYHYDTVGEFKIIVHNNQ